VALRLPGLQGLCVIVARVGVHAATRDTCLLKEQGLIAQNMVVAATAGKANPVEIFEDLNRQLAPDVQRIAEIRRAG
jgi:hypothetical protein